MHKRNVDVIGFDWDGTLVDSMKVKSECFAEAVIRFYPKVKDARREIEKMFMDSRGTPRVQQLSLVQKKYGLDELSSTKTRNWSDAFTSLYIKKKLPLFEHTIGVLYNLKSRDYRLFLSSSVPQDDLENTLKAYPLQDFFEVILGSKDNGKFRKGLPHFSYVSQKIGIPLERMAFVGDGADDVKFANEAGCFSVGIADPRVPNSRADLEKSDAKVIIERLDEVLTYF
jgi:phosphoglycolate phosphatase-like HAD superfamily hydrolase